MLADPGFMCVGTDQPTSPGTSTCAQNNGIMMSYELDLNPIEQRARQNGPIRYRMEEQHKELRYTDVRKHINFQPQILFLDIFSKSLLHI